MTEETRDKSGRTTAKEKAAAERAERLRKQLRANLQRRKGQTRARNTDAAPKT